jgi:hypothetical protein
MLQIGSNSKVRQRDSTVYAVDDPRIGVRFTARAALLLFTTVPISALKPLQSPV